MGFILISVQTGREHDVQQALSGMRELAEKYALHYTTHSELGYRFDFLVKANATDSSALRTFVEAKIRAIPGVAGIKSIAGMSFSPADRYIGSP